MRLNSFPEALKVYRHIEPQVRQYVQPSDEIALEVLCRAWAEYLIARREGRALPMMRKNVEDLAAQFHLDAELPQGILDDA